MFWRLPALYSYKQIKYSDDEVKYYDHDKL